MEIKDLPEGVEVEAIRVPKIGDVTLSGVLHGFVGKGIPEMVRTQSKYVFPMPSMILKPADGYVFVDAKEIGGKDVVKLAELVKADTEIALRFKIRHSMDVDAVSIVRQGAKELGLSIIGEGSQEANDAAVSQDANGDSDVSSEGLPATAVANIQAAGLDLGVRCFHAAVSEITGEMAAHSRGETI